MNDRVLINCKIKCSILRVTVITSGVRFGYFLSPAVLYCPKNRHLTEFRNGFRLNLSENIIAKLVSKLVKN